MGTINGKVLLIPVLTFGLILLSIIFYPLFVQAGSLSARSDVLETSRHGLASKHTFQFTTTTPLNIEAGATGDFSFKARFPTNATADPFTIPSFVAADATATCTSCGGATLAVVDVIENNEGGHAAMDSVLVVLDAGTSGTLPGTSSVTVNLGVSATKATNPADDATGCLAGATSADADVCSITFDTTESLTNPITSVDSGDVLVAFIAAVTVTATVNETLSFSINGVASASCTYGTGDGTGTNNVDTTSSTVPFGTLTTTNTFYKACQDLSVSTNATNGYNVTEEESTNLRTGGAVNIPDTTCDGASCSDTTFGAWATATNNGLGHACRNLVNAACTAGYDSGGNFRYRQFACKGTNVECDPGTGAETQQTIMSSAGPASGDSSRVHYKISVVPAQQSGDYTTFVTYVTTPIF